MGNPVTLLVQLLSGCDSDPGDDSPEKNVERPDFVNLGSQDPMIIDLPETYGQCVERNLSDIEEECEPLRDEWTERGECTVRNLSEIDEECGPLREEWIDRTFDLPDLLQSVDESTDQAEDAPDTSENSQGSDASESGDTSSGGDSGDSGGGGAGY